MTNDPLDLSHRDSNRSATEGLSSQTAIVANDNFPIFDKPEADHLEVPLDAPVITEPSSGEEQPESSLPKEVRRIVERLDLLDGQADQIWACLEAIRRWSSMREEKRSPNSPLLARVECVE